MATINEMRQVATQIENETTVGGNTAERVGGLFNDIVDELEEIDGIMPLDESPTNGSMKGVTSGGVYAFVNYGQNTHIDPTSVSRINADISPSNVWEETRKVYCRIIPITETGDYTIVAINGLAAFAVLTTNTVTIGGSASYAPGYSLVNMAQGESTTVNIASGLFLYVRDDNNQTSGRILPNITLVGQNDRCLRESDITDNLTNVSKIPTSQAVKDFIEIGGGISIDPTSVSKNHANITASGDTWEQRGGTYCRIIPITETGDYTITAVNGLAAFAVLTTNTVTIGDSVSYASGYSLVNLSQGEGVTINIANGLFLYVRDDTLTGGRVLPSIVLGIADPVIRQSDLQGIGKKVIKCLFIGNSVNQDHIGYLPWLLRNAYGDTIDFTIAIAYKASYTIKGYVEDIMTGNVNLDIFSIANNSESWTNYNNYPFANIWANFGNFDLISFEGYFNHGTESAGMVEDVTYFNTFIDNLITVNTTPFKVGYLMHQTYNYTTHTEEEAWERIVNGAKYAISDTPVSILFPCGAVTKIVNGEIPQSMLTNDNIHNQQGLPCIMGAYVVMEELSRYYGTQSKIIGNRSRITATTEDALNIPGKNGTLQVGTDSQYILCQKAAVKAVKWGDNLLITNSDDL